MGVRVFILPPARSRVEKEGKRVGGILSRVRECDGEMETEERLMCIRERESERVRVRGGKRKSETVGWICRFLQWVEMRMI